jgi:hypothetical protein
VRSGFRRRTNICDEGFQLRDGRAFAAPPGVSDVVERVLNSKSCHGI